ncbi:MAG: type III-A CRISPR-associated protein Cas10/Csm1 [Clostridia bacterium]
MLRDIVQTVSLGALLHDIGKVLHRAGNVDGRAHSISGTEYIQQFTEEKGILDCIRYHHRQELIDAHLPDDSPAYIVYIADNIASGADRRENEGETTGGFDKNRPLASVFNLLNNNNGRAVHRPAEIADTINYPETISPQNLSSDYNKILSGFSNGLAGIYLQPEYINSLLDLCEAYLSYVPSSTYRGQVSDISLFDHSKITAALAACIALYLEDRARLNYRAELFEKETDFFTEKAFCLLSIDISGIQQFIYTISSKGALRALRSRSFYLEVLLENTVDEILSACRVSRANLLYTGGGHAYILLPNTDEVQHQTRQAFRHINQKLMEHFDSSLFIAYGLQTCSANELISKTDDPESYTNIFRSLSAQISSMKLRRYSADDIRRLNATSTDKEGRECSICGTSARLKEYVEGMICKTCAAFAEISRDLIKPDCVFAVLKGWTGSVNLPLFSADGREIFLQAMTEDEARRMLKENPDKVVRLYSKNMYRTGLRLATKLWMGDFAARNHEGGLKTFVELSEESEGIDRIGVLQADVDNLGTAFVRGFIREGDLKAKYRYVTISRTATLSRSLSIFFKYYMNLLLDKPAYSLTGKQGRRNAVIVYSGGDDMFIVGAWDEVLSAAVDIRKAFSRYTGGTLTLSAGFAIFDAKYPISRMAKETEELERRAKQHQDAGNPKNAISLFGLEMDNGLLTDRHTYSWDTFENKVLGEKYATIRELFAAGGDYGNVFLYSILYLLREADEDKINIARLAYLLARREPARNAPDALKEAYKAFTTRLYRWAMEPEDRRQLITAILLYIYTMRDEKEERDNG